MNSVHLKREFFFTLLVFMFLSFPRPILAGLNDGLAAYYPFHGNARDESGHGLDGIVHGAQLTMDRFENPGHAYLLNGINDYIELPYSHELQLALTDYSLTAWIKTSTRNRFRVISKGSHYCATGYMMRSSGGVPSQTIHLENSSQGTCLVNFDGQIPVNDGQWHLVSGVIVRKTGAKIFVDGKLDASISIDTSNKDLSTNESLLIGISNIRQEEPFAGSISDVRVYDRALSDAEISDLYSQESFSQESTQKTLADLKKEWSDLVTKGFQSRVLEKDFLTLEKAVREKDREKEALLLGQLRDKIAYLLTAFQEVQKANDFLTRLGKKGCDVQRATEELSQTEADLRKGLNPFGENTETRLASILGEVHCGKLSLRDLKSNREDFNRLNVQVAGKIRKLDTVEDEGYQFTLDDGTALMMVFYPGSMRDTKVGDDVAVSGVYNSAEKVFKAANVEKAKQGNRSISVRVTPP